MESYCLVDTELPFEMMKRFEKRIVVTMYSTVNVLNCTLKMMTMVTFICLTPRKNVKSLSHALLFATPWTVAYQAPLSVRFSRQEDWSGLPFPSPGDPPNPETEPWSPALEADALTSEPPGKPCARLCKLQFYHDAC